MDIDTRLQIQKVEMENSYGYMIRMYTLGPFLVHSLPQLSRGVAGALSWPGFGYGYIAQDWSGEIIAYSARPRPNMNTKVWTEPKAAVCKILPAFQWHSSALSREHNKYSLEGICNHAWKNALVPKYFLNQAEDALSTWYRQYDTTDKTVHCPVYSIAMRKYMQHRRLKSISK